MKKLLTALFIVLFLSPLVAKITLAATSIPEIENAQAGVEYTIATDQPTGESFNSFSFDQIWVNAGWAAAGGKPMKGMAKDGQSKEVTYSKGLIGDTSQAIAWIFQNPAASTEAYIADLMNSAGIVQPAQAQGLGFAALDPILNTWKTFRNMAYLLFVVVFMVIGFLIMMRQKVGGQTVVTAQQAIPQIIVTLVLVTFSYAIAGFLIDVMYLFMYLLLALFQRDEAQFLNKNFLTLGLSMISSGSGAAFKAVDDFAANASSTLGNAGKETMDFLGGLTLAVIVAIAIALKVFELFFELLKTYVIIILTIAFSPVILAMGAIPGKNTFSQWIKDLIGNLAAFPAVMLVLIVFDELTNNISKTPGKEIVIETGGFQPPYLFGSGTGGSLPFIVGVGMLMIMPEIVKEVKKAMGAKEGIFSQFARDIGGSLKKGWTGGELIPGLAMTDTRKLPFGGVSGENLFKKEISVGTGLIGGGYQAIQGIRNFKVPRGMYSPNEAIKGRAKAAIAGFKAGGASGAARGAMFVGDETVFPKQQKRIKDEKGH